MKAPVPGWLQPRPPRSSYNASRLPSGLKNTAGIVMSRVLALGLKELPSSTLIEWRIVDQYPPTTFYHITRQGRRLVPVLERL